MYMPLRISIRAVGVTAPPRFPIVHPPALWSMDSREFPRLCAPRSESDEAMGERGVARGASASTARNFQGMHVSVDRRGVDTHRFPAIRAFTAGRFKLVSNVRADGLVTDQSTKIDSDNAP